MKPKTILTLMFLMIALTGWSGFIHAEDALKYFDYSYHHKLINKEGNAIRLNAKSLVQTQQHYIKLLTEESSKESRKELRAIRAFLKNADISDREQAHIRSELIEVLAKRNKTEQSAQVLRKNRALKLIIDGVLFNKELIGKATPFPVSRFTLSKMEKSSGSDGLGIIFEILIRALLEALEYLASLDDYERQCFEADVPLPPDWGSSSWVNAGVLNDEFIGASATTTVFVYNSTAPEGTCVALPRSVGSEIRALGIICLGVESENACFWDGEGMQFNSQFRIRDSMRSGMGLARSDGSAINGECTDCHAGQNPFIARQAPSVLSFSGSSINTDWYTPIGMHPSWVQNPGPTNLLDNVSTEYRNIWFQNQDGLSCIQCHQFPDVAQLPGYCNDVLKPSARRTMPNEADPAGWSWPNTSEYRKHIEALRRACP